MDLLAIAESRFEAKDMALHVAVVRRRKGQLLGGLLGEELIKTADEFMVSEDIKKLLPLQMLLSRENGFELKIKFCELSMINLY